LGKKKRSKALKEEADVPDVLTLFMIIVCVSGQIQHVIFNFSNQNERSKSDYTPTAWSEEDVRITST